jgi:uncharacterized protein (TIGR02452 family)
MSKQEEEKKKREFFEREIKPYRGPFAHTFEVMMQTQAEVAPHSLSNLVFTDEFTNEAIQRYYWEGNRVTALNFANADTVGGGVANGKKAQEEDLMRASPMLYHSIANTRRMDGSRIANPIKLRHTDVDVFQYSDWGGANWDRRFLVSNNVEFIRLTDSETQVRSYFGTVITAAAPNHRGEKNINRALADKSRIKLVIRNIIETAAATGCEVLVLGAWGCGAFAPDVETDRYRTMIAQAFGEVLATSPATFKSICFPIRDTNMRTLFQRTIEGVLSSPPSRPFPHCKAPGCEEAHQAHFCNCCGDPDSTHRSSDCPSKKGWACSLQGGNVYNNFTKYLKYKKKYLALKK